MRELDIKQRPPTHSPTYSIHITGNGPNIEKYYNHYVLHSNVKTVLTNIVQYDKF
jgi:hypothetical protein